MPDTDDPVTPTNLAVDRELVEQSMDAKEKETGVFHWRGPKGKYYPVTEMSPEEIERSINFCDKKMNELHETISRIHRQMHAWQYREEKLSEERDRRFDGISSRAANQTKELTE